MGDILRPAARTVVRHERIADPQLPQQGKKRKRRREQRVPQVNRAVHVKDDVAKFSKPIGH
jgi:hypothetical protein